MVLPSGDKVADIFVPSLTVTDLTTLLLAVFWKEEAARCDVQRERAQSAMADWEKEGVRVTGEFSCSMGSAVQRRRPDETGD
jgi:hypothetical protein